MGITYVPPLSLSLSRQFSFSSIFLDAPPRQPHLSPRGTLKSTATIDLFKSLIISLIFFPPCGSLPDPSSTRLHISPNPSFLPLSSHSSSSSSLAQLQTVRTLQPVVTSIPFHFSAMETHANVAFKGSAPEEGALADDVFVWLSMEGDVSAGGELLNLLEDGKDTAVEPASTAGRVRFIDDPYSSLLVFQSSSSYITINGNEESCGSSFSDSGTSVMASIDTNGLRKLADSVEASRKDRSASGSILRDGLDGCKCNAYACEWDYEVIARFLGDEKEEEEEGLLSVNN